jgi:spore maturation protein A
MFLSRLIGALAVAAVVFGLLLGRMPAVSSAVLTGAGEAVTLVLGIAGTVCLWSGLMEVMARSGLAGVIARALGPIIRRLFGRDAQDPEAGAAIAQNMAANLLGLGDAATPAGLRAAARLKALSDSRHAPPRAALLLMVINSASLQLLPTNVAALRGSLGASAPYDILPAVWLTSAAALVVGILAAKSLSR